MEAAGYDRADRRGQQPRGRDPRHPLVGFDSEADTILLEHRARSRAGFARGALRAARWVIGRRGFHEFSEIWEETL